MSAPTLRFKEFESKVEVKKLGNISNIVVGFVGTVSDQYCDPNEGIPFVRTQNVREGYFSIENLEYVTKEFHKKNKKSQIFNGDVLIARVGANMGMVCAVENLDTEANCANVIIIKNNPQLNSQYLSLFLNSENGQKQIHSGGAGGAQAVFNTTLAKEISFPYFPLQEQTKIASFLSAVDEKINHLTQKHQLLSQYKQGMMQKLFSQQIRFKADDGSEFGEWDEYSLDTLLSKIIDNRGKTPVTEANLEIPLIEVNAIGQRRIKYEKVSKYFSEDTFQNWFRAYLEHQDILFSTVGNTAICSIYTDEIKAGIAQNIVGLRANTKLIQPTFLYYLLTEISNNQKFKSIEMQAVQPSIKVSQMIHLTFLTPCLEEQIKIADFLSSIDQKIEVVTQQIEQGKLWKKGLLQQMFV